MIYIYIFRVLFIENEVIIRRLELSWEEFHDFVAVTAGRCDGVMALLMHVHTSGFGLSWE